LLAARPTVLAPQGADRGRIAPGATLAISIEPLGGSPTGLPTGPVVATGVVARV
jgi:anti-sigma-K factor RskA